MFRRQVLLECISALLIMLFLYASISKFLDFTTFIGEMNNQPLPNSWTPFLVWFIPCSEILICLALLFERTRLLGFYASLGLMSLFTIYSIIIILNFFGRIPCSCGGVIKRLTWTQHIVLNLFYVALSITGIVLQRRKFLIKSIITTKNSFV
jgi:putative oxidoreductase